MSIPEWGKAPPPGKPGERVKFPPLVGLDTLVGPVLLEDDVDGLDDFLVLVGLAIDDDLVLERLGAIDLDRMLLGQTVVPAAVPDRQVVRVSWNVLAS